MRSAALDKAAGQCGPRGYLRQRHSWLMVGDSVRAIRDWPVTPGEYGRRKVGGRPSAATERHRPPLDGRLCDAAEAVPAHGARRHCARKRIPSRDVTKTSRA